MTISRLTFLIVLLVFLSCHKNNSPTEPVILENLPLCKLAVGNSWTYANSSMVTTYQIIGYETVNRLNDAFKVSNTVKILFSEFTTSDIWFQDHDTLKIYVEAAAGGYLKFKAFVWPCDLNAAKTWGSYKTTLVAKNVSQGDYDSCVKYRSEKINNNVILYEYAKPGFGFINMGFGDLSEYKIIN